MKNHLLFAFCVLLALSTSAQTYTSYFTGSTTDVSTTTQGGTVLMGGATEDDNAMIWFLQRAGGGDVVVLRATGSDGYNTYLYTDLGVTVNSVETIVVASAAAANNPYVSNQIRNAEALWIAGGDQYDYVSIWKNSPMKDAINYLINEKNVTIGGTSAGMAIMGDAYFSAQNGSVTSAEALANPYNTYMTIGYHDFLNNPYLQNTITDTHYDNPDRKGRHTAFLAKMMTDLNINPRGIASEEYTAVCIDENGIARVFGNYPNNDDFAYFLQTNCTLPNTPETCQNATPLTWDRNQQALKVCKIAGTPDGSSFFDLNDWTSNSGGAWKHWYVQNGIFTTTTGTAPTNVALNISGNTTSCSGGVYTYTIDNPTVGATYTWTAGSNGTIVSGQGTPTAQIQWTNGTAGIVSVTQN
jgi:cyanophycinase-like exopeptidase